MIVLHAARTMLPKALVDKYPAVERAARASLRRQLDDAGVNPTGEIVFDKIERTFRWPLRQTWWQRLRRRPVQIETQVILEIIGVAKVIRQVPQEPVWSTPERMEEHGMVGT